MTLEEFKLFALLLGADELGVQENHVNAYADWFTHAFSVPREEGWPHCYYLAKDGTVWEIEDMTAGRKRVL